MLVFYKGGVMSDAYYCSIDKFMKGLIRRNPGEHEFHQAVYEVALDIVPFLDQKPVYREHRVLERLTDRIVL